jgi:NADPH:quinone reductase-like Zn-dependent oxidoreductase
MESKVTRQAWRRQGKTYPQPLELVTEEIGVVEPTDVLIEVHGWALNYRDTNMLQGTNPWPILLNGIVGADAAGIVLAVGRSVTQFAVGDRASPITNQKLITGREQSREWLGGESEGVLATHIVMHEQTLVHVPEHLSWTEAAILPVAGATAWSALIIDGHLTSGKTVLVQGIPLSMILCIV